MEKIRWRYAGLLVLTLGLILVVTISGLAQEQTPTPIEGEEEEVDVTPTVPVTPTVDVTEEEVDEEEGILATTEEDRERDLELTVYNQNLGLVKEVHTFDLTEGENEIGYAGVATEIEPTSVHFVSLTDPEGTVVLEQNYAYDIASTRDLLLRYVDQEIAVRTVEGDVYTGTLLSGLDDVILASDEGFKMIKMGQVQEVSFPAPPDELVTKPTLAWLVRAAEAGEQDVRITYLTEGINWQADYIATLGADDDALSMIGWVTLNNQSGATYEDARLKLVAGDVHRVSEPTPKLEMEEQRARAEEAAVQEREFFSYHLYEVERPVTVRDRQTKQIEFVTAPDVTVDRVFVYEPSPTVRVPADEAVTDRTYGLDLDRKVRVMLEFVNEEKDGLGMPLPKGKVRVYKEDVGGGAEFVGEDAVDHTPEGEELSLHLGNAFDIVGERTQLAFEQVGERVIEESYRIALRNQQDEEITVRVIEHLFRAQDAEVLSSSEDYEMIDANTLQYELDVPVEAETAVTYTVRYEW
ncbi:MAG: DUF4139 domain-containing protein [Anaerolineae bacterium]